jgi:succinylglutamate desuccinylase
MTEEIIELRGDKPGPKSIILVGVHGDEKCGPEALKKVLPLLQIEYGTVFIAYGNPEAIKKNTRFTDVNLNRIFKDEKFLSEKEKNSYEYKRSRYLIPYLNQAEVLLDVHASYTPESRSFIICSDEARELVQYLPFDLTVSGFDEIEPGGTDYYMNRQGKIGICIECGYLGNPASTQMAEKSITLFLEIRGHIKSGILKKYKQTRLHMNGIYITKTDNFKLVKEFNDFDKIIENQVIGYDGNEEIKAEANGFILFARDLNQKGEEAFCFGEYK